MKPWLPLLLLVSLAQPVLAERVKDIATFAGVRSNPLIGYGIVVGLDGTGDSSLSMTNQSMATLLGQLGVQQDASTIKSKNVAAVSLTAVMPAYARPGQQLDVTVSSLGNSKSLRGGTLLMSPLKGADGQIYALAQGNLLAQRHEQLHQMVDERLGIRAPGDGQDADRVGADADRDQSRRVVGVHRGEVEDRRGQIGVARIIGSGRHHEGGESSEQVRPAYVVEHGAEHGR